VYFLPKVRCSKHDHTKLEIHLRKVIKFTDIKHYGGWGSQYENDELVEKHTKAFKYNLKLFLNHQEIFFDVHSKQSYQNALFIWVCVMRNLLAQKNQCQIYTPKKWLKSIVPCEENIPIFTQKRQQTQSEQHANHQRLILRHIAEEIRFKRLPKQQPITYLISIFCFFNHCFSCIRIIAGECDVFNRIDVEAKGMLKQATLLKKMIVGHLI